MRANQQKLVKGVVKEHLPGLWHEVLVLPAICIRLGREDVMPGCKAAQPAEHATCGQ